jgi:uncharacterized membrane protein
MQRVERSIRVSAPVSKVYDYWRDFHNFPRFMVNVEEVRLLDAEGTVSASRTSWKAASAPARAASDGRRKDTHEAT